MTKNWLPFDPGAESLVLTGPVLERPLTTAALKAAALHDAPQIAVDGGIRFARNPILWAGDGDSCEVPSGIPVMLKKSQDETDLRFCLNGVRPWHWRELHLFGFIGGRRDHELANFGEIHAEMKRRSRFQKCIFYGNDFQPLALFYPAGGHIFAHHGLFSILAFETTSVTLSGGCKYSANDLLLEPLSGACISNEASGDVVLLADKPLAVFLPHA